MKCAPPFPAVLKATLAVAVVVVVVNDCGGGSVEGGKKRTYM